MKHEKVLGALYLSQKVTNCLMIATDVCKVWTKKP